MAVKLHRCGAMWIKGPHPCWRVQKALDDAGVAYEVVKHPGFPRGRRKEVEALSGQRVLPLVELEDGRIVRGESNEIAERIRAGRLHESGATAERGAG